MSKRRDVCALETSLLFSISRRHQLRGSEQASERLLQSISAQLTHSRTDRNICVRRAYYLFLALREQLKMLRARRWIREQEGREIARSASAKEHLPLINRTYSSNPNRRTLNKAIKSQISPRGIIMLYGVREAGA